MSADGLVGAIHCDTSASHLTLLNACLFKPDSSSMLVYSNPTPLQCLFIQTRLCPMLVHSNLTLSNACLLVLRCLRCGQPRPTPPSSHSPLGWWTCWSGQPSSQPGSGRAHRLCTGSQASSSHRCGGGGGGEGARGAKGRNITERTTTTLLRKVHAWWACGFIFDRGCSHTEHQEAHNKTL